MAKAMLVMDFENEIAHEEGKLAKAKGYSDFIKKNGSLNYLKEAIKKGKEEGMKLIYVKVEFQPDYSDQPKESPLFGKADEFQALKKGSWGTEFISELKKFEPDKVVSKNRVSPFYNTDLESYLESEGVGELYLVGVATDMVVLSAAKEGHDRDFKVKVLSKACAAASEEEHEYALKNIEKYSEVIREF